MLHYRIHGFLGTELLVRNLFQNFIRFPAMKVQRFTNIWKAVLAPFAPPSNYAPEYSVIKL